MTRSTVQRIAQARERIDRIRQALGEIDTLCSGTLLKRMKVCGYPAAAARTIPRRGTAPTTSGGT